MISRQAPSAAAPQRASPFSSRAAKRRSRGQSAPSGRASRARGVSTQAPVYAWLDSSPPAGWASSRSTRPSWSVRTRGRPEAGGRWASSRVAAEGRTRWRARAAPRSPSHTAPPGSTSTSSSPEKSRQLPARAAAPRGSRRVSQVKRTPSSPPSPRASDTSPASRGSTTPISLTPQRRRCSAWRASRGFPNRGSRHRGCSRVRGDNPSSRSPAKMIAFKVGKHPFTHSFPYYCLNAPPVIQYDPQKPGGMRYEHPDFRKKQMF